MLLPRILLVVIASALLGSCARPASQARAQVTTERTMFTDSSLYARYCRTTRDSLMPVRDSLSKTTCELRDQRQSLFKIF
jgi:hypothetical protein